MNQQEQIVVFVLATLFKAARIAGGGSMLAKDAFKDAEEFIKEAKNRGIDLEKLK